MATQVHRTVGLAVCLAAACFLTNMADAQFLGGDFRNTTLNIGKGMDGDMALNVQTGGDGNPQATGGVTAKEGDKVSFDNRGTLSTKTAGFWKGEKDKTYGIQLRSADGKAIAIVKMQGVVRWNTDRNVIEGNDSFLRISTDDKTFIQITGRDVKDGRLHISAADGSQYSIYALSCDFSAAAERMGIASGGPSTTAPASASAATQAGSTKAATQPTTASSLEPVSGKIRSVSMTTVAGPKSLFDTTLEISEKDPKSTVVMEIEGKANQEFRILTSEVVSLDGFIDLKGKHEALGGLLILSELQKRLVGKEITIQCRKIAKEDGKEIYGVAAFEIPK